MQSRNVPAVAIGIIENGKITKTEVLGELEKGKPAPSDAIFNVASLTKPIFAMTVMKLVEAKKWNLDDPVFPYWLEEDLKNDERYKELTARIMLSHQTGFPNWRYNQPEQKLAFQFDPKTKYQYSGEGYEYLKNAIQNKFKKTFQELADSIIFKPLDMKDSKLIWDDKMEEERFAKWHDKKGNVYQYDKRTTPLAADDLMTTIEDYCKFGKYMMAGGEFSDENFQEIVKGEVTIKKNVMHGLGWRIIQNLPNNEYALVHGGADRGVRARVILLPKSKNGIVVFTNGDKGNKIIKKIVKENLKYGKTILKYL